MDAEVWSHADIRNGQRLFPILVGAVLLKEVAVIAGLAFALPWAEFLAPPTSIEMNWPPALQAMLASGLLFLLLLLAFLGRRWALVGFGLIFSASSGYALFLLAPQLWPLPSGAASPLAIGFGNGVLGLMLGTAGLMMPQLRAFIWSQANTRLVIPLPDDDAPPRRSWRQHRTFAESLISLGRWLVNIILILTVLLMGAWIYGFGDEILALMKGF